MNAEPTFPPLLKGLEADIGEDPFELAIDLSDTGCDPGTVVYAITQEHLRAAIILAPEVPLSEAMAMLIACGIGFANALGALGAPEVAVQLGWDGTIFVNGATCGGLGVDASIYDPDEVPDWLVVGLTVAMFPENDLDGGDMPDETTLFQEGCGAVDPVGLLESWARHTLVWINRWSDDGPAPLHAEWTGMAYGIGNGITTEVSGETVTGKFLGTDEDFGMLIKTKTGIVVKPLTELLVEGDWE
jgi:BirA family biotin operon repressor/biotin-[acetyl-CoA-carboxylase] ligase